MMESNLAITSTSSLCTIRWIPTGLMELWQFRSSRSPIVSIWNMGGLFCFPSTTSRSGCPEDIWSITDPQQDVCLSFTLKGQQQTPCDYASVILKFQLVSFVTSNIWCFFIDISDSYHLDLVVRPCQSKSLSLSVLFLPTSFLVWHGKHDPWMLAQRMWGTLLVLT